MKLETYIERASNVIDWRQFIFTVNNIEFGRFQRTKHPEKGFEMLDSLDQIDFFFDFFRHYFHPKC